ncbi:FlgD immunoglobulin-like domain containing protein [Calditrichota bacterium]
MILKAVRIFQALLFFPFVLLAQNDIDMLPVGSHYDFWETASSIEISGNNAIVATGSSGMRILDISSPEAPIEISALVFQKPVSDLKVAGNYAFLACANLGVVISDISDPEDPVAIDTIRSLDNVLINCNILEYTRGYLYIFSDNIHGLGDELLAIVNVTNPENPTLITILRDVPIPEYTRIYEPYLYLVCGSSYTYVYDISTPGSPLYVSHIAPSIIEGNMVHSAIAVTGEYAYVLGWTLTDRNNSWLRVWDLSDPANPDSVALVLTAGIDDIEICQGYAYATGATRRDIPRVLVVLEVSNPANPHYIGQYDTPGKASNFTLHDSLLYLNDGYAGISIYNTNNPRQLQFAGTLQGTGNFMSMWRINDELVLHEEARGLLFLDISDPTSPEDNDSYSIFGNIYELASENDLLLATGHNLDPFEGSELMIMDVSNPEEIVLEATYGLDRFNCSVAIKDQTAYIGQPTEYYSFDLLVLDLRQPANPVLRGRLLFDEDTIRSIICSEDLLLLIQTTSLDIYDISNPMTPESLSRIEISPYVNLIEGYVYEDHLYLLYTLIVTEQSGIRVIDISNPEQPQQIHNHIFETLRWVTDFSGENDRLAVLDKDTGFIILDISDPENLIEIDRHNLTRYPWTIELANDYVFLPTRTNLDIFEIEENEIQQQISIVPTSFSQNQNFPNPFNPSTTISFSIPRDGFINISIYDISGRLVRTLSDGVLHRGSHQILWDGLDSDGKSVSSGTYFYAIKGNVESAVRSMTLIK